MIRNKTSKNTLSLIFFFSCISSSSFAQQGSIKGRVTGLSGDDAPVVSLLNAADSSMVKVTICETDGKYEFELMKDGNYIASVIHLGYHPFFSAPVTIGGTNQNIIIPDIALQRSAEELKEVEITAKKPFVTRKIDRVVVDPSALIGSAGNTSLEILEKAPGVLVDINGNISLKGKQGVIIFIDNKPTYMSGGDVVNYLRSLPASSIESIEIMTNPPAGYDASGNAGIINLKLKRTTQKGINGGVNLSYGQGRYMRTNNSFNLNYRVNKVNLFGNVSFSQNNSYQDLTIDRYYYTPDGAYSSGFSQNSYIKQKNGGRTARIGMDYYVSKRSTLGVVFSGFISPSEPSNSNKAQVLDANNEVVSRISALTTSKNKWMNGSANVNYAYRIDDKGKELTANADYITYNSKHDQKLVNSVYTPDGTFVGQTTLDSKLPADITIKTIKLDYGNPLGNSAKFDVGFKASLVNTDNTAAFFDVVNEVSTPNYDFSNRFKYKENINAGYVNFAKDWSKFSIQLGLRMEHTNMNGDQLGNIKIKDSSFSRNYASLFPTLYLAYRADTMQKHQFGFSFGRRIDRPSYQDLNPFTYPMDRFTYYAGNPFLQPTFSYNFELSHTYKNYLTTTLEYSIVNNLIQETNEQRATIYYSRPGNFGKQIVYGASVNGAFQLTKWWMLQLYSEYKNITFRSDIYGQKLDESKWYWYVGPTNQFAITKTLSAELAGSYQTRILVGQFLTIPVWQAGAGVALKILKEKGSIKMNLSDMFYTNQPGGDIRNIANSKAKWLSYLDSRVVTVSFSYRFNKGKSLNARQSGASDTEKRRVKTN